MDVRGFRATDNHIGNHVLFASWCKLYRPERSLDVVDFAATIYASDMIHGLRGILFSEQIDMRLAKAHVLIGEADRVIADAATHDIVLTYSDFRINDCDLYIDGMNSDEWLEAMTMD